MSAVVEFRSTAPAEVELRSAPAPAVVDGKRLRGQIPYNVESRAFADGSREVIDAGALDDADLSDLILTVEHNREALLARYPGTLSVELTPAGLDWSAELADTPRSVEIRSSVERGDLAAGSWGMIVSDDYFVGDVRHVAKIAALVDVSVSAQPVYRDAAVSYRSVPVTNQKEVVTMELEDAPEPVAEATLAPPAEPVATPLRVETRSAMVYEAPKPRLGLAAEFRSKGFPQSPATVEFAEFRAFTFSGTLDPVSQPRVQGGPLGYDQRWAWSILPQVGVGAGDVSVSILAQTARTIPSAASMSRVITSVATKPEVASTLALTVVPLRQVPAVVSGIPNVYLEQPAFSAIIEGDLKLALNVALDGLVVTALQTGTPFQAPSTDNRYVSIRKSITTLQNAGYNPDTVILTPADAELLDTMVSGLTGGTADFTNGAGNFGPDSIFGLRRVVSASVAASIVVDSTAVGKLYSSPVALARFEENAGGTNTSLVRMECNAVVGVERTAAVVRIAAS